MRPSAYHAKLAKDQLVEDRDGVKVVYAGGSVFHLRIKGAERPISVRGAKAAWDRAEAERKKLNPDYHSVDGEQPSQQAAPIPAETEGVPAEQAPVAPADNDGDDEGEGETEGEADDKAEGAADVPPAKTDGDDESAPEEDHEPDADGAVAFEGDPVYVVSLDGEDFPVVLADVEDVRAMLGPLQGRLDGFIGNPTYQRLTERVRATDGCCAPIFFVEGEGDEPPSFYTGLETLGAAIHLGMKQIAVLIVPAETAKVSQGPISFMFAAANAASANGDDEMVFRAYN